MHLTWLDSNSWLIELAEQRILLDPWLVGPLMFGNLPWLFKGSRRQPRAIPDQIDLILLSQGLEDHAHKPTLAQIDRQIPVVGSPSAAKVAQELGYTQVTALQHGGHFTLANAVEIEAVPGAPVGPQTVENGYVITARSNGASLYYEPHGFHAPILQERGPVDVVITPIINLEIPLLGPVIKGQDSAVMVSEWLKPKVLLPTAAGGDVEFEGLLLSVIKASGSADTLRDRLQAKGLTTRLMEPEPGVRFQVELATV